MNELAANLAVVTWVACGIYILAFPFLVAFGWITP